MTLKELLIKMRKTIDNGWCQFFYHLIIDGKDCYCFYGAMKLHSPEGYNPEVYELACEVDPTFNGMADFNDNRAKSKQDVLDFLDKMIAIAI